jgi:hypothetical protein
MFTSPRGFELNYLYACISINRNLFYMYLIYVVFISGQGSQWKHQSHTFETIMLLAVKKLWLDETSCPGAHWASRSIKILHALSSSSSARLRWNWTSTFSGPGMWHWSARISIRSRNEKNVLVDWQWAKISAISKLLPRYHGGMMTRGSLKMTRNQTGVQSKLEHDTLRRIQSKISRSVLSFVRIRRKEARSWAIAPHTGP